MRKLLVLLFLFPFLLPAQETIDSVDFPQDTLNEFLLTALRVPYNKQNTAEAIDGLSQTYWAEKNARTSPEALAYTPGVFVQKTNHGGGSPILRGLTGNQTLQLIDGVRLNNATYRYGPNQYFNTIDAFALDRIEVLRGGGSVQYGSDALGGTIQALTEELPFAEGWYGKLIGRMATQDMEYTGRGVVGIAGEKVSARLGLSAKYFGDLVGGDTTGRQSPSEYEEACYDFQLAWKITPNIKFTAASNGTAQNSVPIYHKVVLEGFGRNEIAVQDRYLHYGRLEGQTASKLLSNWKIQGSYHQSNEERRTGKIGIGTIENDTVRTTGGLAQFQSRWSERWTSVTGVDYYRDKVDSRKLTFTSPPVPPVSGDRGLYPDGSTMNSLGIFSLHEYGLNDWQFSAGLRYNRVETNVSDEDIGEVSLASDALVWNAGVLWHFQPQHAVFVNTQTGFRAPNINDLGTLGIVDFRYEVPNFDLSPEKSFQFQLGYRLSTRRLQLNAYIYQNQLTDLITRVQVPGDTIQGFPVFRKENLDEAVIRGFETDFRWYFKPEWYAEGTLTYTYGEEKDSGAPLRRIPPLFGRFGVGFQPKQWTCSAEILWAAKQDRLSSGDMADNRIPDGGTPGWAVLNLHAAYSWRFATLRASGINLFNADYRTHGSGINGYGRSLWLTVEVGL